MRAEIISVGTELLLGDILNTNAQFLAQELAALGYSVYYQTVVGDNATRLRHLVADAKERSDILIFTGGLGPTNDDLTKETVAEAFGDTLVPDAEELVKLEHFFKKRGLPMTENNKKQAMVPRFGKKLPNANGTAPGAFFREGAKYAILLPGPPREMKPMFLEQVLPLLESMQDGSIRSVVLRVFGIGESALEDKVRDYLSGSNPTAALYAKTGEVHIRITAKSATAEQADVMCDEMATRLCATLGDLVYSTGGEDLETVAVGHLAAAGATVATAESCTGGLLGQRLTSVPGASAVYGYGAITYANEAKEDMLHVHTATLRRYGAVSSQVAAEMAFGAAKKGDADYGVGITGIAGPDGGTAKKPVGLVYVAVCTRREVYVKKLELGNRGRAYVRELATHHALDMLRRAITGLPVPQAKLFTRGQMADFEREGKPLRRGGGALRALMAILAVALVLLAIVFFSYQAGEGQPGDVPDAPISSQMPSARGHRYGSREYADAAMALVRQQQVGNPAVAGLIALPDAAVESLVAQTANGQQASLAQALGEAGVDDLPVLAADAVQTGQGANPLLLGDTQFIPLLEHRYATMADSLSTFTYFTGEEARLYKVLGVYLADEGDVGADKFDPAVRQVTGYAGFLSFFLGLKARSLYDVPVDTAPGDAFMTLAVQDPEKDGRMLYVCGRRLRPSEDSATPQAAPAGSPLMPAAWYTAQNTPRPNQATLHEHWLRWYLLRGATNSHLQLGAGMPEKDTAPMIPAPKLPSAQAGSSQDDSSSQATSGAESGSSSPAASQRAALLAAPVPLGGANTRTSLSSGSGTSLPASSVPTSDASGFDIPDSPLPGSAPAAVLRPRPSIPLPLPSKPDPFSLTVTMNGEIVTAPTRDILAQICQAEAAGLPPEAVKALAICAHSWILNQQGAGNAAPAVVGAPPSAAVQDAVQAVEYQILSPDGENPAFTPWFTMAANGTNTAQNVFGAPRPYLVGASSPEQGLANWTRIVAFPTEEFAVLLLEMAGIDLTAYDADPSHWLGETARSENGYVESIEIGGETLTGFALWRRVLAQNGAPLLPSPAFEAAFDGEKFNFICYGEGHGCGLSLLGAGDWASQGWTCEAIMQNYFPGCEIITW